MTTAATRSVPVLQGADEEVLETLAHFGGTEGEVQVFAAMLAWHGFTLEELQLAWCDYAAAVIRRDQLGTGERAWFDFWDEMPGRPGESATDAAIQRSCEERDVARHYLLTGARL